MPGSNCVGGSPAAFHEINDIEPRAAHAKRTDGAVFRKGAGRELHVAARSGADGIKPSDGGVFRGDGGEDRAADFSGWKRSSGKIRLVPGATGMSEQYDQSDSAPCTSASEFTGRSSWPVPPGPASMAETTMQPKL